MSVAHAAIASPLPAMISHHKRPLEPAGDGEAQEMQQQPAKHHRTCDGEGECHLEHVLTGAEQGNLEEEEEEEEEVEEEEGEAGQRRQRGRGNLEEQVECVEGRKSRRLRPFPVLVSGKVVDLYSLNSKVRQLGGYCKVTSLALWGSVAQELGLEHRCGPSVKLVYFKYLRKVEKKRSVGSSLLHNAEQHVTSMQLQSSSLTLLPPAHLVNGNSEVKSVVRVDSGETDSSKEDQEPGVEMETEAAIDGHSLGDAEEQEHSLERRGSQRVLVLDCAEGNLSRRSSGNLCRQVEGEETGGEEEGVEEEEEAEGGDGASALGQVNADSLAGMLQWIRRLAVDPMDPSKGQGESGSGQDAHWVRDCHETAQRVRTCLWRREEQGSRDAAGDSFYGQNKQPSQAHYYEEPPDQQTLERLRSGRERFVNHGWPSPQALHRSAATQRGPGFLAQGHSGNRLPTFPTFTSNHPAHHTFRTPERFRKRIPIGSDFQACVPSWMPSARQPPHPDGPGDDDSQSTDGAAAAADTTKWFGKQVWPLGDCKIVVDKDRLGKGRSDMCSCEDVESIDCVRLHVNEEKEKLKAELGKAYHDLGFDDMGESVVAGWTKEEQSAFSAIVSMNPASMGKNFWDHLPLAFPDRSRRELVSYYFNVFVLRRRAIQNRLLGEKIDSDDDETELPGTDSEFSDNYDTGDEGAEDDADDATGEDEVLGNMTKTPTLLAHSSHHLHFTSLEPGFIYSTRKLNADGLEADHVLRLDDVEHHNSHLVDQKHVRESAHLASDWENGLHASGKDHLLEVTSIGDDALQEVAGWEDPHWDDAQHDILIKEHLSLEANVSRHGSSQLVDAQGPQVFKHEAVLRTSVSVETQT